MGVDLGDIIVEIESQLQKDREDLSKIRPDEVALAKAELDEQLKCDNIWNPDKCVEKGLVDEIIKC